MITFTSTDAIVPLDEYDNIRAFCIHHGFTDLPASGGVVTAGEKFVVGPDGPRVVSSKKKPFDPKEFSDKISE